MLGWGLVLCAPQSGGRYCTKQPLCTAQSSGVQVEQAAADPLLLLLLLW